MKELIRYMRSSFEQSAVKYHRDVMFNYIGYNQHGEITISI